MVAAKVDHSGVLVTKFHQNRSTLKCRSAGQRHADKHTDRQTNSAENKGPSGLQSGQKLVTLVAESIVHFVGSNQRLSTPIAEVEKLYRRSVELY